MTLSEILFGYCITNEQRFPRNAQQRRPLDLVSGLKHLKSDASAISGYSGLRACGKPSQFRVKDLQGFRWPETPITCTLYFRLGFLESDTH